MKHSKERCVWVHLHKPSHSYCMLVVFWKICMGVAPWGRYFQCSSMPRKCRNVMLRHSSHYLAPFSREQCFLRSVFWAGGKRWFEKDVFETIGFFYLKKATGWGSCFVESTQRPLFQPDTLWPLGPANRPLTRWGWGPWGGSSSYDETGGLCPGGICRVADDMFKAFWSFICLRKPFQSAVLVNLGCGGQKCLLLGLVIVLLLLLLRFLVLVLWWCFDFSQRYVHVKGLWW